MMIQDTSSPLGTVQALTGIPFSVVTRPCSNSELCTVHTRTARRRYVRYLINTRHPALNVRLVSKQLFSQFSKDNPRYCSRRGLRSLYLEERDTLTCMPSATLRHTPGSDVIIWSWCVCCAPSGKLGFFVPIHELAQEI